MDSYVLGLEETDRAGIADVGGKAAGLGVLSRIEGIAVPAGFCVTTHAFRRVMADRPLIDDRLDQLASLHPQERDAIARLTAQIRRLIEAGAVADDVADAISNACAGFHEGVAFAVRSSATAEDLPTASFAGQHDSYLNVFAAAVLEHVGRCWASLFTERAVTYRLQNGLNHRTVEMAVVVQQMIFPRAAGVLFTADPVTSNREIVAVESVFGLGKALVSGIANADVHKVRDGQIIAKTIATKALAVHAAPGGGAQQQPTQTYLKDEPALSDDQVLELVELGRRIEEHFEAPQDIEWCMDGDGFHIVQSRPITTLFPIPRIDDGANHVYVSVGHQQMMTDPMKPLGVSLWQLTAGPPMHEAGGRLFVDVARHLSSPSSRAAVIEALGASDPLIRDALQTIIDRGDFVPSLSEESHSSGDPVATPPAALEPNLAIVTELMDRHQISIAALKRDIQTRSGPDLFDFILDDINELKRLLFDPYGHQVYTSAMDATTWLNEQLWEWLGEKNAADTLTQSVPHNVTSAMGLALLDVADAIRPHQDVVNHLRTVEDDNVFDNLAHLDGGREAADAIVAYLDDYGMRCVGEIDITRPRWSEHPSALVPMILTNMDTFEPGESERRFRHGLLEAQAREQELLERLHALPGGDQKANETKRNIDLVRTFIGYREYPKYGMVTRYFEYKKALLSEAERLVESDVLGETEDIYYLTFHELHDVVRTNHADGRIIRNRKDDFRSYHIFTPPRVLTSDGEAIAGTYRRNDVPTGALVGLPVSAGSIEGRARVILDMAEANPEPGDILVTAYTDPSWTPLFVAIAGLVTEVGGLMTHGAVIAREYGLPAVVGVEHVTRLIQDGQVIRVNGTDGYVEVLPAPELLEMTPPPTPSRSDR